MNMRRLKYGRTTAANQITSRSAKDSYTWKHGMVGWASKRCLAILLVNWQQTENFCSLRMLLIWQMCLSRILTISRLSIAGLSGFMAPSGNAAIQRTICWCRIILRTASGLAGNWAHLEMRLSKERYAGAE